ncbi:winged helix-turn-helix transcriptional regulator [Catenulispora rubra]|uniref:winged helix-turn-helix transcriptional regulator n=1 Tax=Catenulispora rubra TaxID=280293 RepID=UPI0018920632|nr:helix-turn-helix domain-containing protein [Catenulispora rubra]
MSSNDDLNDDEAVFARGGEFIDRDAFGPPAWCALERSLDVIGTRSAMMLVREAFYGGRRFDELVRRTGLAETVAAQRLKQLVAEGLMEQRPYREPGARTRKEHVLTDRGRDLFPVVVALVRWGRALDGERRGVDLVHADCGALLSPAVHCEAGHEVSLDETVAWLVRDPDLPKAAAEELGQGR